MVIRYSCLPKLITASLKPIVMLFASRNFRLGPQVDFGCSNIELTVKGFGEASTGELVSLIEAKNQIECRSRVGRSFHFESSLDVKHM